MLGAMLAGSAAAAPLEVIDLADVPGTGGGLFRLGGSVGSGTTGVPVAGGLDVDGLGDVDLAMASMRGDPLGRFDAGIVYLVFGDGTVSGEIDTALPNPRVLEIYGDIEQENAGSEIWIDDVTGDGTADLLIARQNYTPAGGREGAGALTILMGEPALETQAAALTPLDLRSPPVGLTLLTIVGDDRGDRLGIWMRTGDVTGDGIADIVVGADQASSPGENHHGEAYVIRGGSHLATTATIDLGSFGSTALAGDVVRIRPPANSDHFHTGATVQIGDLDGDGLGEVLLAAALTRGGAGLPADGGPTPHSAGGAPDGTLFIVWDEQFIGDPWPAGHTIDLATATGVTTINGGTGNEQFGEEILAGEDYDGDGTLDLFVGDIVGDPPGHNAAGMAHILFDAHLFKGQSFDLDTPPAGVSVTTMYGAANGDIAGDTAVHGDFDGDGLTDLVVTAPHADTQGRVRAGIAYLLLGRAVWPSLIDFDPAEFPSSGEIKIIQIDGANGADGGSDAGDTLAYSGAAGDVDGDGRVDLITNEMLGNGVGGQEDVGNLIVLSGAGLLAPPPTPTLPLVGYAALGRGRRGLRRLPAAAPPRGRNSGAAHDLLGGVGHVLLARGRRLDDTPARQQPPDHEQQDAGRRLEGTEHQDRDDGLEWERARRDEHAEEHVLHDQLDGDRDSVAHREAQRARDQQAESDGGGSEQRAGREAHLRLGDRQLRPLHGVRGHGGDDHEGAGGREPPLEAGPVRPAAADAHADEYGQHREAAELERGGEDRHADARLGTPRLREDPVRPQREGEQRHHRGRRRQRDRQRGVCAGEVDVHVREHPARARGHHHQSGREQQRQLEPERQADADEWHRDELQQRARNGGRRVRGDAPEVAGREREAHAEHQRDHRQRHQDVLDPVQAGLPSSVPGGATLLRGPVAGDRDPVHDPAVAVIVVHARSAGYSGCPRGPRSRAPSRSAPGARESGRARAAAAGARRSRRRGGPRCAS